ncbi:MAG: hypothetical protein QXJ68_08920 [Methanocellales archaeon]
MREIKVILLLCLIISLLGCVSQPPIQPTGLEQYIPARDLPRNFKLAGIVNNTSIADLIMGELEVNVTSAVKGYYFIESAPVDGYVLVVKCASARDASNATQNYLALYPEFPPSIPISRFSLVSFNGHTATQILGSHPDPNAQKFIYKYIWQKEELIFIVSGSEDPQASLRLAQLTGS